MNERDQRVYDLAKVHYACLFRGYGSHETYNQVKPFVESVIWFRGHKGLMGGVAEGVLDYEMEAMKLYCSGIYLATRHRVFRVASGTN